MKEEEIDFYIKLTKNIRSNIKGAKKFSDYVFDNKLNTFIAVDFHLIYEYRFPKAGNFFHSDNYIKNQFQLNFFTRRFIFEILPRLDQYLPNIKAYPLVLLPPYAEEMAHVYGSMAFKVIAKLSCDFSKIENTINHFKSTETYEKLLKKDSVLDSLDSLDETNIEDLALILDEFLFCYSDNINKKSIDTLSNKKNICWPDNLKYLAPDNLNIKRLKIIEELFNSKRSDIFKVRANIHDSVALEYLISASEDKTKRNRLVFITGSNVVFDVYRELKRVWGGELPNNKFIFRPEEISLFLLNLGNNKTETRKQIREFSNNIKTFTNRFDSIFKALRKRVDSNRFTIETKLNVEIQSIMSETRDDFFQFMRWKLYKDTYGRDEHNNSKFNIISKIFVPLEEIQSNIFSDIKEIMSFGAEEIQNYYFQSLGKNSFYLGGLCGGVDNPFASTFDSYFFKEYDYVDSSVGWVCSRIKSGNISEAIKAIQELIEISSSSSHNKKTFEAKLLLLHLLSKSGYDDIDELNQCIHDLDHSNIHGIESVKLHFQFLKNIFLSRSGCESLIEAVKNSTTLSLKYGQKQPRFYLQAGYLKYRLWEECPVKSDKHFIESIEDTENALKFARENNHVDCEYISLSNLSLFYLENNEYDKCIKFFQLKNKFKKRFKKRFEYVPFFSYVEGMIYKKYIEGSFSINNFPDIKDVKYELKNIIEKLTRYLPISSKYTKKKFISLINSSKT